MEHADRPEARRRRRVRLHRDAPHSRRALERKLADRARARPDPVPRRRARLRRRREPLRLRSRSKATIPAAATPPRPLTNTPGVRRSDLVRADGRRPHRRRQGNGAKVCLVSHDDGSGAKLYVVRRLVAGSGVSLPGIATWDGSSWSPVGTTAVFATSMVSSGGQLYVDRHSSVGPTYHEMGRRQLDDRRGASESTEPSRRWCAPILPRGRSSSSAAHSRAPAAIGRRAACEPCRGPEPEHVRPGPLSARASETAPSTRSRCSTTGRDRRTTPPARSRSPAAPSA